MMLHKKLQLSLITECKSLITCALNTSKKLSKDHCLDEFEKDMLKACKPQEKKFDKEAKMCHKLLEINNTYANFLTHDFFTESKKKFLGIIKFYEYPSFKESSNSADSELECYLGDLKKGFGKECRKKKNLFVFYELENGKFSIENSMDISEFVGVTKCVAGMELPELRVCDFEDEGQQYDVRVVGEDLGEDVFIENFGEFVEVVVVHEFKDFF